MNYIDPCAYLRRDDGDVIYRVLRAETCKIQRKVNENRLHVDYQLTAGV